MSEALDLTGLTELDRETLRSLATRLRKLADYEAQEAKAVKDAPRGLNVVRPLRKPADKLTATSEVWCTQCELRVGAADAARCTSKWCGGKVAFGAVTGYVAGE